MVDAAFEGFIIVIDPALRTLMEKPRETPSSNQPEVGSVPEIYVNSARMELSLFDLGITFGTASPGGGKDLIKIRMSPQHALIMTAMLANTLAAYEAQIGAINLPERVISEMHLGPALEAIRKVPPEGKRS